MKPCPFCGCVDLSTDTEQIEFDSWVARIECGGCEISLSPQWTSDSIEEAKDDAAEAWDRRPGGEGGTE